MDTHHRPSSGARPPSTGAHRAATAGVRLTPRGRALVFTAVLGVLVLGAWMVLTGGPGHGSSAGSIRSVSSATGSASTHVSSPPATSRSTSRTTSTSASTKAAVETRARATIASLIAAAPAGAVSVAVQDLSNGASFSAGATSGMMCASVAKVQILESVLMQNAGPLSGDEDALATRMIENSDNDAADALFADLGGPDDFAEDITKLGLDPQDTRPGPPYIWGLTTTSAMQHLILMHNLVSTNSPLSPASQSYMLALMRSVEADQRWGVPEVADPGTTPANKNGWLNITDDDNLWAVNSDGVVTVHGQQLIMSVFTQHSPDMASGQQLVSKLVAAAAQTVTG